MTWKLLLLASFGFSGHASDDLDDGSVAGRIEDPELSTLVTRWQVCGTRCYHQLYPNWAAQARELAPKLVGTDAVDAHAAAWQLDRLAWRRSGCLESTSPLRPYWAFTPAYLNGKGGLLAGHEAKLRGRVEEGMVLRRDEIEAVIAEYRDIEVTIRKDGVRMATYPTESGEPATVQVGTALLRSVENYLSYLEDELLPSIHTISTTSTRCYAERIAILLGEDRDPHELHVQALSQLRDNRERTVAQGEAPWAEVRRHLMAQTFDSEAEVLDFARQAVIDGRSSTQDVLEDMELGACDVERGVDWAGLYHPATPGVVGWWQVDVLDPQNTPRVLVRSIGAHECWPGHHVQMSFETAPDLPRFRTEIDTRIFIEGWATYAENLPNERGYLRDADEELGPLVMDAWRTTRVLVDTGIHAEGWTLEQARDAYREWTILPEHQIDRELETIAKQPAWLLAHKLGGEAFRALRAEAEAALGDDFDAREFHRLLLREGEVPLPALRVLVREWLAGRIKPAASTAPEPAPAGP